MSEILRGRRYHTMTVSILIILTLSSTSLPQSTALSSNTALSPTHSISVSQTFSDLLHNTQFRTQHWQTSPLLLPPSQTQIRGQFTVQDIADNFASQFIVAGRGTFNEKTGGWNMAAVGSTPRPGASFEDAKVQFSDVQNALSKTSGTVVINSAGAYIPSLAKVCEECLDCFGLPINMNLYITAAGQVTSAPPHTDKQDVFVVQTQGKKHWRVYEPPEVALSDADPLERGKASDKLGLGELKEPVLDAVLEEGCLLYIPAGWPHTTDTVHTGEAAVEPAVDETDEATNNAGASVHLTIGVDTHIWGMTYASLREYCLARAGQVDTLSPLYQKVSTNSKLYWDLQDTLPFGFLSDGTHLQHSTREELSLEISSQLSRRLSESSTNGNPTVSDESDDQIESATMLAHVPEVVNKLFLHHKKMMNVFSNLYADVAYELTDVPMNVGFLRSRPYFDQLEVTMDDLVTWGQPVVVEEVVAKSGFGGKSSGGGMGGGGGGGGGSKKAKKKKKKKK